MESRRPKTELASWIAGIISAILAAVALIYSLWPRVPETRAKFAQTLTADLVRIRTILPYDQAYSDCIARRLASSADPTVEPCLRERRASPNDPLSILDRHIAEVQLHFQGGVSETLQQHLGRLRYLAYEMQNNQMVLERWRLDGCARGIRILHELPSSTPSAPRCTLAVQNYSQFLARAAQNTDRASTLKTTRLPSSSSKLYIVEGISQSIDEYFNGANNQLLLALEYESKAVISLLQEQTK